MQWAYNPKLKKLARELRKNMTLGEVLLWRELKNKEERGGYDFHRQKPIDEFIIDFFSTKLALAIEIDGSTHNFKADADRERQKRLEGLGIRFLRFTEKDVCSNLQGVLDAIDRWIIENSQAEPKHLPSADGHLPS